jgi:hypothetical protein
MFGVIIFILLFTALPSQPCDPLYVCPESLYYPWIVVDFFIVFIFCSILYNLWSIKQTEGLLQNIGFYLAVITGLGTVAYGVIVTLFDISLPRVVLNLLILCALILLAYSVARQGTLVSRRMTRYDLPITLATIAVIVVVYVLAGKQFKLSGSDLFLIAVLAVFTHSAYDFVRDFLDRLVNRQEHQMRQELHTLGREASEGNSLQRYLSRGLAILCHNLHASCGFIATRQADQYTVVASLHSLPVGAPFPSKDVAMEGLAEPTSAIFQRIAWLAPAFIGKDQTTLVGIGLRRDKIPYSEEDLYWLEDIAQEIGEIIHLQDRPISVTVQESQRELTESGLEASQPIDQGNLLLAFAYKPDLELVKCIEDGYRHLHDYDQLGKSPLVSLFGVQGDDHLENGKLVHNKLIQILEKLRPAGQPPPEPLPSEWFAYTILHDSYVKERLSREIMAKLYIGEGTYYRLRRQALRGITRAVLEMGTGVEFIGSS